MAFSRVTVVGFVLFLVAAALLARAWVSTTSPAQGAYVLMGGFVLLAAALILIWPDFRKISQESPFELPVAVRRVQEAIADISTIQRESRRAIVELHDVHTQLERLAQEIDRSQQALNDLHANFSELAKLRQHIGQLERELTEWRDTAIAFFDLLERQLDNTALPADRRTVLEEVVRACERIVGRRGLTLIRPQPGDPFVPGEHRAVKSEYHPEIEKNSIVSCVAWGIREGSRIVRSAEVVLSAGPEDAAAQGVASVGPDEADDSVRQGEALAGVSSSLPTESTAATASADATRAKEFEVPDEGVTESCSETAAGTGAPGPARVTPKNLQLRG